MSLLSPFLCLPLPPARSRFRRIRLVEFHYRTSTTVKLVPRDFANYGNQGAPVSLEDTPASCFSARFLFPHRTRSIARRVQLAQNYISRLVWSEIVVINRSMTRRKLGVKLVRRDFARVLAAISSMRHKGTVKDFRQEQMWKVADGLAEINCGICRPAPVLSFNVAPLRPLRRCDGRPAGQGGGRTSSRLAVKG